MKNNEFSSFQRGVKSLQVIKIYYTRCFKRVSMFYYRKSRQTFELDSEFLEKWPTTIVYTKGSKMFQVFQI